MSELRGLGVVSDEMQKAGGRLIGLAVDPPEKSRGVIERNNLNYSILSDPGAAVIRQFGVLHERGGERGQDIAIPAMFLIDREGNIVWRRVAQRIQDRPDPQTLIGIIHEHFKL